MMYKNAAASALALLLSLTGTSALPTLPSIKLSPDDPVLHSPTVYDAIVVGGGPAGLAALSGLARVRRNVLLLDSGEYRNDPTRHMHDVLGFDGVTPAYFRWAARKQLSYYETVSMTNATVTNIEAADNGTFTVTAKYDIGEAEEATVHARKIVLATGLRDILPATPGVMENWGKGIYWCPWCDGNEHANQTLGLLCDMTEAPGMFREISTLNNDVIAFVNGTLTAETYAATEEKFPHWEQYLALNNVTIENRTIASVNRLKDGGAEHHDPSLPTAPEYDLFRVDFTEGPPVERAAFFASFPNTQKSDVGQQMGVTLYGDRLEANQGKGLVTNVPGVYAVGDANSDNVTNVPHALFSGKRTAVYLHVQLAREESAAEIAANSTDIAERSFDLDPTEVWGEMNGGKRDMLDAGDFDE
ncbi:sulphydryl oxidase [Xylariaceae sp. FL0016]|nr:sulphydryl oxidase [Xylariaceae sp. FL0016]